MRWMILEARFFGGDTIGYDNLDGVQEGDVLVMTRKDRLLKGKLCLTVGKLRIANFERIGSLPWVVLYMKTPVSGKRYDGYLYP